VILLFYGFFLFGVLIFSAMGYIVIMCSRATLSYMMYTLEFVAVLYILLYGLHLTACIISIFVSVVP
jgi:hypothetical protein